MASPKPRSGGVQNNMEASTEYTDLNMVCTSQSQGNCAIPALACGFSESPKQETGLEITENVENHATLQCLMQVFEELGIQAKSKPYTRSSDKALKILGHDEAHQENVPASSLAEELHLPRENKVVYCKNLFLKDRREQFYIVVCLEEHSADLKMLKQSLNAHRNLSFGDSEALRTVLQLNPGAVTPLAIMHESAKDVRVAFHSQLIEAGAEVRFAFHPLCGQLQVELSYSELVSFVEHFGRTVEIITNDPMTNQKKKTVDKSIKPEGVKEKQSQSDTGNGSQISRTVRPKKEKTTTISDGVNENHIRELPAKTIGACYDTTQSNFLSDQHSTFLPNQDLATPTPDLTKLQEVNGAVPDLTKCKKVNALKSCLETDTSALIDTTDSPDVDISYEIKAEKILIEKQEVQHENTPIKAGFSLEKQEFQHENTPIKSGFLLEKQELNLDKAEPDYIRPSKTKRIFLSRKGKLRSYVQKNTQARFDTEPCGPAATQETEELNERVEDDSITAKENKTFMAGVQSSAPYSSSDNLLLLTKDVENGHSQERGQNVNKVTGTEIRAGNSFSVSPEGYNQKDNLLETELEVEQIEQNSARLEIIEEFYSSLSNAGIKYEETDLSSNGVDTIAPSVGCRCFLLKDKGGNFFFVVSHELYELDFGRLKAALRPKKKLAIAQPADIITVLGVDPMKMSPFSVLTMGMRDQQPKVYITEKAIAPNLMLCVQHPFAQARRILIRSAELQNYFKFLGIHFSSVEEKQWHPKYNVPFSQFDKSQALSDSTEPQRLSPEATSVVNDKVTHHSDPHCTKTQQLAKDITSCIFANIDFSLILTIPLYILTFNTFPFFHSLPRIHKPTNVKSYKSYAQGSSVDRPNLQKREKLSDEDFHVNANPSLQLHLDNSNTSVPMTTQDLENHLCSQDIKFEMKTHKKRGDTTLTQYASNKDNSIIEQCSVMFLTNSCGHCFLIIGAQDEFPMSVKRFCRRSRIREHLDIRIDPQEEMDIHTLEDIAPRMLPFALAFPKLRVMIWDRFRSRSLPSTSAKSVRAKATDPHIAFGQSIEQREYPPVTVALTTTLYIDPATIMEFCIGQKGCRLRMTSSEFEKYCRQVGFEIIYY